MTIENNNFFDSSSNSSGLKIKIIGVGGAGTNAVDGLKLDNLGNVRLAVINTDAQALANSPIAEKLVIGRSVSHGLSAGGEVEIGRRAAESDRDAIARLIADMDLIILVVGLGGGTGSAVAPILAEVSVKTDALVLSFATQPFSFEGARRQRIADDSLGELRNQVHGLITLPNDVLLQEVEEDTSVLNAFAVADQWIGKGINSICAMLLKTGLINQDFSALRAIFKNLGGKTLFATGSGSGEDFVKNALEELFICPLLHMGDRPANLDCILVNIIGGANLGISKVNTIVSQVSKRFGSKEDIVFGAVIDEALGDRIEICILAKADLEVNYKSAESSKDKISKIKEESQPNLGGIGLDSQISQSNEPPRTVHKSKLSNKKSLNSQQNEFAFDTEAQRGYFDKTERNMYKDEDLDVPTFMRRGIKIRIKT
ncbi:MAG: cell division protein FtsZ [Verrucomicrobiota bacterium]|nr:cell division protein FtsZ [Verrucomicrobiota bacterium]